MKSKFITAIFISVLLLVAPNVRAANFIDNQLVDANKTWAIKFTSEVGLDNGTIQGITVTDSIGATVLGVGLQLGQDNKTVTVTAPEGGYTPGESYTLNVGAKTHSSNGNALKNEYKVHFNIKNDSSDSNIVTFKDTNLENVVRTAIKKPTGDIYKSDVEKVTSLFATIRNIHDISGIENLTNLQELNLCFNVISDISPLKRLANLQKLNLYRNEIIDISSLKGLTNLKELYLGGNQIKGNQISDISVLEGLTNLQQLDLSYNKISDIIALKGLTNLQKLNLSCNQISDISALKGLTNLQELNLGKNVISDISPLKGLANLQKLYLSYNQISDADEQSLKNDLPKCQIYHVIYY